MVSTTTGRHTELTMNILKAHIAGIINRQVFLNAYPSVFGKCHSLLLYATLTRLSVCCHEMAVLLSLWCMRAEKSSNVPLVCDVRCRSCDCPLWYSVVLHAILPWEVLTICLF